MAFNVATPGTYAAGGALAGLAAGGPLGAILGGLGGGIAGLVQETTAGYDPYQDPNFVPGVLPGADTALVQGVNEMSWDQMTPAEKIAHLESVGRDMATLGEQYGQNTAAARGAGRNYAFNQRALVDAFGQADPMAEWYDLARTQQRTVAPAVALMEQAAKGSAPSAAELLLQQGLEGALQNQLAAAAANRGTSVGSLAPGMASSAVDATLSANQQAAVLRAQEMEAARAQWMQALLAQQQLAQNYLNFGLQDTSGKRSDYLTQMGMENQKQQFNAGQALDMFKTGASAAGQVATAAGSAVKGGVAL